MCEVIVREGGGDLLPTETGFISPREAQARLPPGLPGEGQARHAHRAAAPRSSASPSGRARCVSNDNVATFIKELVLALPEGEDVPFRAGGYVQIECPAHVVEFRDMAIAAAVP